MSLKLQKPENNGLSVFRIFIIVLLILNLLVVGICLAVARHREKYSDWRSEAYRMGPWLRSGTIWETEDGDIIIKSIRNQKTSAIEVIPYALYDGEWHELSGFGIVTGLKKAELWNGDNSIRIRGDIELSEADMTLKNCENMGSIDILNGRNEICFKARLSDDAEQ